MGFLTPTNFNIALSVLGGWITLSGLFSHLLKERYYLSEARQPARPCHLPQDKMSTANATQSYPSLPAPYLLTSSSSSSSRKSRDPEMPSIPSR